MEGPLEISFVAEGYPSLNILNEMKMKSRFNVLIFEILQAFLIALFSRLMQFSK